MLRNYFDYSACADYEDDYRSNQEAFMDGAVDMAANMLNNKMTGNVKLGASAIMMNDDMDDEDARVKRFASVMASRFFKWNDVGDKVDAGNINLVKVDIGGEDKIEYIDTEVDIEEAKKSPLAGMFDITSPTKKVVDNRLRDAIVNVIKDYTEDAVDVAEQFMKYALNDFALDKDVMYRVEAKDAEDLVSIAKVMHNNDTVYDVKDILVFNTAQFMIALAICEVEDTLDC